MTVTIILKDGTKGEFSSGIDASDWFDKQMLIRQTPEQQDKKNRKKESKQNKK